MSMEDTYKNLQKIMLFMESADSIADLVGWLDGKLDDIDDGMSAEDLASLIREDPQYKWLLNEAETIRQLVNS